MLRTTLKLINKVTKAPKIKKELAHTRAELKQTKARLGFAHTTINDLRYAKRERDKVINALREQLKF